MADEFSVSRIEKLRYRPTREADEFLESLRRDVVPGERYRVARLAFARSLQEACEPPDLERGIEQGSAIEGMHLFGEDAAIWGCLFSITSKEPPASGEEFRALVERHWHRGAGLLKRDLASVSEDPAQFALLLASRVERTAPSAKMPPGPPVEQAPPLPRSPTKVSVRIGEEGIDIRANAPAFAELNVPGVSPHVALMGKTRSGKTRTGVEMARSIAAAGRLPVLFIDPKGEFVKDGALVAKSEWGGKTLADRFPGIQALDVPVSPIPLDFLAIARGGPQPAIAQAASSFRDSFQKCIRAKGDVALANLRSALEDLLRTATQPISLVDVRDAVDAANRAANKKKDSIQAKLEELTSFNLFQPTQSPAQFFGKRWAVGLGSATEESRRLVIFLLLDALSNYLLALQDAPTDAAGNRGLRHLLVIDEAKEILSYRHGALGHLVRKSAAKGGIVMLLSQSPEDFDAEEEDFLSHMGTIGVFTSSAQSVRSLRAALGRKVDPEEFSDRSLPRGVALVKRPQKEATKVLAWKQT